MTENSKDENDAPKAGSKLLTIVVCVLLVAGTAGVSWVIFSTEPEAERSTETRESAMLVEVVEVERGNFSPQIKALGRVRAAREVRLSPRVSGQVVERSPTFNPGGLVAGGEALLAIDPADYENALQQRRSELSRAEADLKIEMGRQRVAEADLELLGEEVPEGKTGLALREPQLATAKAEIAAAEAAVRQAELDLERTRIVAPFEVQVMERTVDVGSQVAPGDELGLLVGQQTYWVVATVPLSALPWISIDDRKDGGGSPAEILDRSAWPAGETRSGRVERLIGTLDENTRLARLLVTVDDPLARQPENKGKPALILESIIEAVITGREIENIVRLERAYLREGDTTWVMDDDGKLRIAELEIVFRDNDFAYVKSGLDDGDLVVTTGLTTLSAGAPLRLEGGDP